MTHPVGNGARPGNTVLPRLSAEQCHKVHSTSLEILERVGVRLDLEEAVAMLKKAGATVGDDNLVRVPSHLVERALSTAPKQVVLHDRHGEPALAVGGHRCFYGPGSDCLNIIDHRDRKRRKARLEDVVDGVVLCDSLPEIDFAMSMVLPSDVDTTVADRHQMEIMLAYTTKPIIFVAYEFEGCVDCVQMAELVAGGHAALSERPSIACYVNAISGIHHNEDALQKLLYLSSKGIPVCYIPSSTGGVTSPITPAGSLAFDYAGVLAGLVLSQLRREGAPFIVPGMPPGQLDMLTMVSTYCEPERGHGQALAHHYDLPMFSLGGASEAKTVDAQAAAEAALSLMVETLAGGNIIHDLGYLESGLTYSLVQLVICTEIVSWIRGFVRDIRVDDDTLGLDVVAEVGADGQFLETEHTRTHCRDRWYPRVFERDTYDSWVGQGGRELADRAALRVEQILAETERVSLPGELSKRLREMVR
ncbi:trimethylamine methyltransferase family protein [Myxococcota bacterium]